MPQAQKLQRVTPFFKEVVDIKSSPKKNTLVKIASEFFNLHKDICNRERFCDQVAYSLQKYLDRKYNIESKVISGQFVSKKGPAWHTWLQVGPYIVDASTKQFGIKGPVVTNSDDSRYVKNKWEFESFFREQYLEESFYWAGKLPSQATLRMKQVVIRKNPTEEELDDIESWRKGGITYGDTGPTARGVLIGNNIFLWSSDILHGEVIPKIFSEFDESSILRFDLATNKKYDSLIGFRISSLNLVTGKIRFLKKKLKEIFPDKKIIHLRKMHESTIAVDLDNSLAYYDGWKGATDIGEPIPEMLERVKSWINNGDDVWIFTARADDIDSVRAIERWCIKHIGKLLPITNVKHKLIDQLWDDKSINPWSICRGGSGTQATPVERNPSVETKITVVKEKLKQVKPFFKEKKMYHFTEESPPVKDEDKIKNPEHLKKIAQEFEGLSEEGIFEQIEEYTKAIADPNSGDSLAIFAGDPGSGKTVNVKKALADAGVKQITLKNKILPYSHFKGKTAQEIEEVLLPLSEEIIPFQKVWVLGTQKSTRASLYAELYNTNGSICVFDDADTILTVKENVGLLKIALDSSKVRTLSHNSRKPYVDLGREVGIIPKSFKYTGKIIIISNLYFKDIDPALRSRARAVNVDLTAEQIMGRIQRLLPSIQKNEAPEISLNTFYEVFAWLHDLIITKGVLDKFDLRTFLLIVKDRQKIQDFGKWQKYALQLIKTKYPDARYTITIPKEEQSKKESRTKLTRVKNFFKENLSTLQSFRETPFIHPNDIKITSSVSPLKKNSSESDGDRGIILVSISDCIQDMKDIHLLQTLVPEDNVYHEVNEEGEEEYGREENPHITVIYGILPDTSIHSIPCKVVGSENRDFGFGRICAFRDRDKPYDVLVVEIHSDFLTRIHNKLKLCLKNDWAHNQYRPHMTIAYVSKGFGQELEGKDTILSGQTHTINMLRYKNANERKEILVESTQDKSNPETRYLEQFNLNTQPEYDLPGEEDEEAKTDFGDDKSEYERGKHIINGRHKDDRAGGGSTAIPVFENQKKKLKKVESFFDESVEGSSWSLIVPYVDQRRTDKHIAMYFDGKQKLEQGINYYFNDRDSFEEAKEILDREDIPYTVFAQEQHNLFGEMKRGHKKALLEAHFQIEENLKKKQNSRLNEFTVNDWGGQLTDVTSRTYADRTKRKNLKSVQFIEFDPKTNIASFLVEPTYQDIAPELTTGGKPGGDTSAYTVELQFQDLEKWAPQKDWKNMTVEEFKEILDVADIKLWCSCKGWVWTGLAYQASQVDSAIYPVTIPDKVWRARHGANIPGLDKHMKQVIVKLLRYPQQMLNDIKKKSPQIAPTEPEKVIKKEPAVATTKKNLTVAQTQTIEEPELEIIEKPIPAHIPVEQQREPEEGEEELNLLLEPEEPKQEEIEPEEAGGGKPEEEPEEEK